MQFGQEAALSTIKAREITGTFGKYEVKTEVTVLKTDKKANPTSAAEGTFNLITLQKDTGQGANGETGGPLNQDVNIQVGVDGKRGLFSENVMRTVQHEAGHVMGADHTKASGDLMRDAGKDIDPKTDVNVREYDVYNIITEEKNEIITEETQEES